MALMEVQTPLQDLRAKLHLDKFGQFSPNAAAMELDKFGQFSPNGMKS